MTSSRGSNEDFVVNPLTLAFPGDIEAVYLDHHYTSSLVHVRLSLLLGIVFYSLFGLLDAQLFPQVKHILWFIRFYIFVPYSMLMLIFSFSRRFKPFMQMCISSMILIGGFGIIAMIVIAPEPDNYLYYAGLILVYLFGYTFFKLRFIWATITGWTIVFGYEAAAIWLTATPWPVLLNNNFFFLTGNFFGMFACYAIEYYSRRDFLQARLLSEEREKVDAINRELEERVLDRTAQLTQLNEALRNEIDERIAAEKALKESELRFRSLSENAVDIICTMGKDGTLTYVNPAWERLLNHESHEVIGRSLTDFMTEEERQTCRQMVCRVRDNGETFSDVERTLLSRELVQYNFSMSFSPHVDATGNPIGILAILKDITSRKMAEEQIRHMACHDPLTGLHNRKAFYERLDENLSGPDRNSRWALLFLDLDHFKNVNDSLGHDVGDELLKAAAKRLMKCLRKCDLIFRLGGDEFTIIIQEMNDESILPAICQRILEEIARPFYMNEHTIYITASIGISVFPNDGVTVESLVKNADMAMYAAKSDKHCYRFFTAEMNERALERMKLDSSLRQAVRNRELRLHYQPIMERGVRVIGMEALVRWEHPEMGLVPPDRFIGLAEETGTILQIGEWVLETACRETVEWHKAGHDYLYVAVNLSARQFRQQNLAETVERVLRETGLPPEKLQLEITETGIMENPETAVAIMEKLHAVGVRFAIDDFGTGYSSLSYLKRFPVDTLKIDRSFVKDVTTKEEDREIIRTIISMARNLNMEPLAEGIETREQRDFLTGRGCRLMQGYLFSPPLTRDKFDQFINRRNFKVVQGVS